VNAPKRRKPDVTKEVKGEHLIPIPEHQENNVNKIQDFSNIDDLVSNQDQIFERPKPKRTAIISMMQTKVLKKRGSNMSS